MKTKHIELDVDYVGSQDPADQPTAEELAALSRYLLAQKQQQAAQAVLQKQIRNSQRKEAA